MLNMAAQGAVATQLKCICGNYALNPSRKLFTVISDRKKPFFARLLRLRVIDRNFLGAMTSPCKCHPSVKQEKHYSFDLLRLYALCRA